MNRNNIRFSSRLGIGKFYLERTDYLEKKSVQVSVYEYITNLKKLIIALEIH